MRSRARHVWVIMMLAVACGRAELDPSGLSGGIVDEEDASIGFDGFTPVDVPSGPDTRRPPTPDTGIFPDARPRPDAGRRDTGVDGGLPDAGECMSSPECFALHGRPPPCPDGRRGTWTCTAGTCVGACGAIMCSDDCDCDMFTACINNACVPGSGSNLCCTNPMCPPGQACIDPAGGTGLCPDPFDGGVRDGGRPRPDGGRPRPDGGTNTIGDPCENMPVACGPFGFCLGEMMGFPDGYCTRTCGAGSVPCPGDSVCREVGGANEICLDGCMSVAECRTGYNCITLGVGTTERVCFPIPPHSMNPNGLPVGADCAVDDDCDQDLTCVQLPNAPGGYCTLLFCDVMTNPCPIGSQCYAFPGSFSLCLEQCPSGGSQSTCRTGYYCLGPTGSPGVCVGM